MQIDPKLKEILRFFYNEGRIDGAIEMYNFDQVIKDNERKILALGKPEPLAKNKQFDNACEHAFGEEYIQMGGQMTLKECEKCGIVVQA